MITFVWLDKINISFYGMGSRSHNDYVVGVGDDDGTSCMISGEQWKEIVEGRTGCMAYTEYYDSGNSIYTSMLDCYNNTL